ncbi:MAG TPA: prephenate dehydratase [Chloroflexota bacterium]|nr:prephenate dehydratase [Chloroflexota bacterium]
MRGVAFQGERGAFSEEAAARLFPDATMLPQPTFGDVFAAVADGRATFGVPAVENSTAGSINETYDLLVEYHGRVFPRGEYDLHVQQCLMALPGQTLADITTVQSHWQALAQCREYLDTLGVQVVQVYDTAGSAKLIREGALRGVAGIAPRRAAGIYGLEILAERIQTNLDNYTRFLVIGREEAEPASATKTSVVFVVRDQPGTLFRAMAAFAIHEVNVIKLESRPIPGRRWEYRFYADIEGHRTDPDVAAALSGLARCTTSLLVIGSYPRLTPAA